MNKLGASLSNEKEIFQAMMNNPQLLNQLPIDPLQPVIYILKAWHKEGAKRSIKNSCRHNNNNLHIEGKKMHGLSIFFIGKKLLINLIITFSMFHKKSIFLE